METTKLGNLKLYGAGHAAGGAYHNVSIKGEGVVGDGLSAVGCRIYGTGLFLGKAETERLRVLGESECKGDLTAGKINIYGTMKVSGSLQFDRFNLKGQTEIGGNMTGESCDVKGKLSVIGDCETEMFHVTGCVDVSGLLNSGEIKLRLSHDISHVQEIGGTTITVKRRASFFSRKKGKLIADVIEGDRVYLDNTEAAVVRGKEVIIGPGCSIGTIEYENKCECDPHSQIKEKTKL
ncbi:hypothetical protein [Bacillus]|uniref:hypothetical protein n=1 Tax=Bacillus TaxID=1386 RepID=UPI0001F5B44E|nr:hypothetical protein [Bacillus]ADV95880.1 hypothetical protein BSn5_16360 [Bacillus subtilis BSn5]KAA0936014.1 hypothetical protein FQ086_00175 [Bacillus sp. ANT_WA51]KFC31397.1 hypothetical protein ZQL_00215 [Bacillus subtilis]MBT2168506.1 hypothetical protein [Bacillus subtilis]MCZ8479835.1 hypothetical protein [Bacillus subtilis]